MYQSKVFVLLSLILSVICYSQESNIWHFGYNTCLDFNSGSPVALPDSMIYTTEGCATISDSSGQLLFYTDGVTVYNKLHQIMPNGTFLAGHNSSTQSAVIIPKPNSSTIYYIFTVPEASSATVGFRYSEVDVSLDGGLGGITANKNILLVNEVSEKVTAVKKGNGTDYWVLTRGNGNNNFYAFSVTESGVNTVPVISSAGALVNFGPEKLGYLKFSPNGDKILCVTHDERTELLDFDDSSGIVSNAFTISTYSGNYGVEFSPSGDIAYLTCGLKLYQYDLTAADIMGSEVLIFYGTTSQELGALQIAPDGKIYIAIVDSSYLGVINDPEVLGLGCNFVTNGISLGNGISRLGLPQFIQSYFNVNITVSDHCLGDEAVFTLTGVQNTGNILWEFGDGTTSNLANPTHIYENAGTYTVKVTVIGTNSTTEKEKLITIAELPIAHNVADQTLCLASGVNYSISSNDSTILQGQNTDLYEVTYFLSLIDAQENQNILQDSYIFSTGTTTLFSKVTNKENRNCYDITSFKVTINEMPVAGTVSDYVICEVEPYDNKEQFDLQSKNTEVLNGLNPNNFEISYYTSQENASNKTAALPQYYINTQNPEQIYARIDNSNAPDCFTITSFNITVIQKPVIDTIEDYIICDDVSNDGIEEFDLSLKSPEILGSLSVLDYNIAYYNSYDDAVAENNSLNLTISNTQANQIVYVAVWAKGNSTCKTISSFKIIVSETPVLDTINDIRKCDDQNDNIEEFDLESYNAVILGNLSPASFNVTYYTSDTDVESGINPIEGIYQNVTNPQTIFLRVQNVFNEDCYVISSLKLIADRLPDVLTVSEIVACEDIVGSEKAIFDLEEQSQKILQGLGNSFNVSYYANNTDALLNINKLDQQYQNTSNPQQIVARIENSENPQCYSLTTFDLIVLSKPSFVLEDHFLCREADNILVKAPSGYDDYLWSNGDKSTTTTIENAGEYSLTVIKNYNGFLCSSSQSFKVDYSSVASIKNIEINDWTDNENVIHVDVEGYGDYEYSIDGTHYQNDPIFSNLQTGSYVLYVRDKNGCGEVKDDFLILSYPKFFTPNNDGINDLWSIKFSKFDPDFIIYIYDRYGKVITSLQNGSGWDGSLNGERLPATDYWFVVIRGNGKIHKGHFSLIR